MTWRWSWWNWKSAILSTVIRSSIFLTVNLPAGWPAARHAWLTDLAFRGVLAGGLGALTQTLSQRRTAPGHDLGAVLLIVGVGHTVEWLAHWIAGTARLGSSVLASIAFSILSTAFNLFAMKRGAFVAGPSSVPLLIDLRRLPRLGAAFGSTLIRGAWPRGTGTR